MNGFKEHGTEDRVFVAPGYGVSIDHDLSERSLPGYEILETK